MNIEFAWPLLALLWPLPWLLRRRLRPLDPPAHALTVPVPALLASAADVRGQDASASRAARLLLWLAWTALLLAAMRPERPGEPVPAPSSGRDLLLVVDISGSMNTEDMALDGRPISRLEAVKRVVHAFVERRAGDRVGLVVFGTTPYAYVPLTFDRPTLMRMLLEVQGGMAGGKTAVGDAVALGVKLLRDRPATDRVIVLLTDGASNAGEVLPDVAAGIAAEHRTRIYSIGFGADALRLPGGFGLDMQLVNPTSDLDEPTLRHLATTTGGRYFRARDTAGLAEVYRLIDAMEPVPQVDEQLRPVTPLYPWPLGFAALCGLLLLAAQLWPARRARPVQVEGRVQA